jgi:hypothetical protein
MKYRERNAGTSNIILGPIKIGATPRPINEEAIKNLLSKL